MADRGVHGKSFDHVGHLTAWAVSVEDYLLGRCVDRHLPPFWEMRPPRALAWLYVQLVDALVADTTAWAAKRSALIDATNRHLADPFLMTEESWGTGRAAEEAEAAWERRFGRADRPPAPPARSPVPAEVVT